MRWIRMYVQQVLDIPDGMGGFTQSLQDDFAIWARHEQTSMREQSMYSQMGVTATWTITARYSSKTLPITVGTFIKDSGRMLRVTSVDNSSMNNRILILRCEEFHATTPRYGSL